MSRLKSQANDEDFSLQGALIRLVTRIQCFIESAV